MMWSTSSHDMIPRAAGEENSPPAAKKYHNEYIWRCHMNRANNTKKNNTTCGRAILEKRIQQNPTNKKRMYGPLVIMGSRTKHTAVAC